MRRHNPFRAPLHEPSLPRKDERGEDSADRALGRLLGNHSCRQPRRRNSGDSNRSSPLRYIARAIAGPQAHSHRCLSHTDSPGPGLPYPGAAAAGLSSSRLSTGRVRSNSQSDPSSAHGMCTRPATDPSSQRGTDRSNPFPSSGETGANLTSLIRDRIRAVFRRTRHRMGCFSWPRSRYLPLSRLRPTADIVPCAVRRRRPQVTAN
jgi:hypothetical protein